MNDQFFDGRGQSAATFLLGLWLSGAGSLTAQETAVAPGAPMLSPSRIEAHVDSFVQVSRREGQELPAVDKAVAVSRALEGGRELIVFAQEYRTPAGVSDDTSWIDAATLAPVRYTADVYGKRQEFDFGERDVRGTVAPADSAARSVEETAEAPFFNAVPFDLLYEALPLEPGFVARLSAYNPPRGFLDIRVEMLGETRLAREAGDSIQAFELSFDPGLGRPPSRRWVDAETGRFLLSGTVQGANSFWRARSDLVVPAAGEDVPPPTSGSGIGYTGHAPDFSGVDRFWELVAELERDRMPSEAMWSRLFSTPAYSYLVEVEGKGPLFRRLLPVAFMPSLAAARDSALAAGPDRYLAHYLQIRERRDTLDSVRAALEGRDLMAEAVRLTADYLPKGHMEAVNRSASPPPLTFALFEPDGKANEEIVVVDLLFVTMIDLVPFLAHEAHHFYKGHLNRLERPPRDHPDWPLVRAVAQIQTEGVADLIDKRAILESAGTIAEDESWYSKNYKERFRETPERLARIDSLIAGAAGDSVALRRAGEAVWELLPFGAHPQGGYMALLIERTLGREALTETLGDPFAFLRAYGEAAAGGGGHHVFSRETREVFERLARTYMKEATMTGFRGRVNPGFEEAT